MSEKAASDAGEENDELPKMSKKTKNKLENRVKKAPSDPRGVIYLGHVPKGFFEPQMKKYFEQFGTVTRLRLARSKRNAHSKGYAFIEFEEEEVAKIVADTMSKYMLFGRTLVCHVIPRDKVHPQMFKIKGKMINVSGRRKIKARRTHNERPTVADGEYSIPVPTTTQITRRRSKNQKALAKLKAMGIEYDFDDVEPRPQKTPNDKTASAKGAAKTGESDAKTGKEVARKVKNDVKASTGSKSPVQTKKKAPDREDARKEKSETKASSGETSQVTKSPGKRPAPSPKVAIAKKRPKKA